MKRLVAAVLIVGLVALVAPTPAFANHRGNFWGGFALGGVTGLVLGSAFAAPHYAPPPVVYQPAPVYVQPAPVYVYPAPVYGYYSSYGYYTSPQYGYGWQPGYAR